MGAKEDRRDTGKNGGRSGFRFGALLLAGVLGVSLFTGGSAPCAVYAEEADVLELTEDELAELTEGSFRASDTVFPTQDKYEYPYMGLSVVLPESLKEWMDKKEVAMLGVEKWSADFTDVQYAFLSWSIMTEEQRDAEVEKLGNGYSEWVDSLERIGTIGIYQGALTDKLYELTGCMEFQQIGVSADGWYYYLSVNPDVDSALTDEIREIQAEITEMTPFQENSVFDEPYEVSDEDNVGAFNTEDVRGEEYTEALFAENDLTLVNIFATWCSPCINEIPDLEKLHQAMADQGVGVVGVVLDAVDANGEIYDESIEKAKLIAEKTGVSYPFLIPDDGKMNGRLNGINAVPETFFVDKDGNIVGETYSGSRSLEEWTEIVEAELAKLGGAE